MKNIYIQTFLTAVTCLCLQLTQAQKEKPGIGFEVSMDNPASHYYHVRLRADDLSGKTQDFKMSAWTPGFYQILDFAKAVENFKAEDGSGKILTWERIGHNDWSVHNGEASTIILSYDIKAMVPFVGNVFLDENRGYITPGGLFMYLDNRLHYPVTVHMVPYAGWPGLVATGLDSIAGKDHTFYAPDYDILFDSPFLMGRLESLPPFMVKGIPHYFVGYEMGSFDRIQFVADLKKIVETGVEMMGDIPYTHYTFLAIGPGGGGIEHLNSTSLSFSGKGLDTHEGKRRMYNFIAHEYFHNFNVKRIRPIELGPFDYSKENHTNLLWVSEGFTVYYEYLITRRAGLTTDEDVLKSFQSDIGAYENKPGHLYQSATQASYQTWSDGPNGRVADEFNKTISYYNKGPVLGLMLDFKIRHETKNNRSLDDVMRKLYKEYYQEKKRGFTEKEFQQACEDVAGTSLAEVFEYASTVEEPDYPKYFAYAGLSIDTIVRELPGAYSGIVASTRDSGLVIREVDWNSPAWNKGLRARNKIIEIEGTPASPAVLNEVMKTKQSGDTLKLVIDKGNGKEQLSVELGKKREKSFTITPIPSPDALQAAIYQSWRQPVK